MCFGHELVSEQPQEDDLPLLEHEEDDLLLLEQEEDVSEQEHEVDLCFPPPVVQLQEVVVVGDVGPGGLPIGCCSPGIQVPCGLQRSPWAQSSLLRHPEKPWAILHKFPWQI